MRSVAVCGPGVRAQRCTNPSIGQLEVDGVPVWCGEMTADAPPYDAGDPALAKCALVRVRAFSCNYRDRAKVLQLANTGREHSFYVLGSEFVGEVISVGDEVTQLTPGDRVIGDNAWPHQPGRGWHGGVPTNHASREYLTLREEKLIRIPSSLADIPAAAFSLAAQTAHSMVEKLAIEPGMTVLVTAARSNTSLFAIGLLNRLGAQVYATTTSRDFAEELHAAGVHELFQINGAGTFADDPTILAAAQRSGGFQRAVDPFFDLHLDRLLPVLGFGARYATCGLHAQSPQAMRARAVQPDYAAALQMAIVKNITIIGNCLGTRAHLEQALAEQRTRGTEACVDSVFGGGDVVGFLHRTFNARDRLGKVVYAYE